MILALHLPDPEVQTQWATRLGALLPEIEIVPWGSVDPETVEIAAVWQAPPGDLAKFPKLRVIVSLAAGIDHLLADPDLPRGIPILRSVGEDLTQRMKEFVALHVLRHHREMPALLAAQARHDWHQITVPPATERRVGVMGLGNLGAEVARLLSQIGFDTVGWARNPRVVEGVTCHAGAEGLEAFLRGTEILVCLLPLTPETEGILNGATFDRLARGACVINVARGRHLVEEDLIARLASGQIKAATLDVFRAEPLPPDHPFWDHPGITVTPHIASVVDLDNGARIVARMLRDFLAGRPVPSVADAARGY